MMKKLLRVNELLPVFGTGNKIYNKNIYIAIHKVAVLQSIIFTTFRV